MLVAATMIVAVAGSARSSASVGIGGAHRQSAGRPALRSKGISADARLVADWVSRSADNCGLPFMIIDKITSQLFLFDAGGTLQATTPVLLGLARGDDSPPGIGGRKLSAITPAERITPAGRFVVETGEDLAGRDILWIDYNAAIALHRASDRKPNAGGKSRVERLSSATVGAKRVSLGCVNVSTAFYDEFIRPTFSRTRGIAYILPETRSLSAEFSIRENDATKQTAAGI